MSTRLKTVYLGLTGVGEGVHPGPFAVLDAYLPGLLAWHATGKERAHSFRALLPVRYSDESARVVDVQVSREHVAYIMVEEVQNGQ